MKPSPLHAALRTLLISFSLGSTVLLLSSCGGGGGNTEEFRGSRTSGAGDAMQSPEFAEGPSPGTNSGCFADVLNSETYDAIQPGMTRSQILASVKCTPEYQGSGEDNWLSEEGNRAYLSVLYMYDQTTNQPNLFGSKYYRERLSAVPAAMPTPVAATCTSQHINAATVQRINDALYYPPGLTPDMINASIGCAPGMLERQMGMVGEQTENRVVYPSFAIYTWHYFDQNEIEVAIRVAFREAEGFAIGVQSSFD